MKKFGLALFALAVIAAIVFALPVVRQELHWRWVSHKNSANGYAEYLESWPSGRHVAEAQRLQDDRSWEESKAANTAWDLVNYLYRNPRGKYVSQARDGLEKLLKFALTGAEVVYSGEVSTSARVVVKQAADGENVLVSADGAGYGMYCFVPMSGTIVSMSGEVLHPPLIPFGFDPSKQAFSDDGALIMESLIAVDGAEHIYSGLVKAGDGYTFESDSAYPLTFKVIADTGYVRICGRGTITSKQGKTYRVGYDETVDCWLPLLKSRNQLTREGATRALGWLADRDVDTDEVLPALIEAIKDEAVAVRRNAVESLGRIGDLRATEQLKEALVEEQDQKVKNVIEEALRNLKK